jgi:hypothetical protein
MQWMDEIDGDDDPSVSSLGAPSLGEMIAASVYRLAGMIAMSMSGD